MGEQPVAIGGERETRFEIAGKVLEGRFAPVAETWLSRRYPAAEGHHQRIRMT